MRDYANPVTVEGPISVKLWREGGCAKMQVLDMPESLRGNHSEEEPIAMLGDMALVSLCQPDLGGCHIWLWGKSREYDRDIESRNFRNESGANAYLSRVEALIRHANTLPLVKSDAPAEQPAPPDPRIAALEAENAALRWLVNAHSIEFISVNGCLITNASRAKVQAEAADIPNALAARAAMERKP